MIYCQPCIHHGLKGRKIYKPNLKKTYTDRIYNRSLKYYQLTPDELKNELRERDLSEARQFIATVLSEEGLRQESIAEYIGRDRSTISYCVKVTRNREKVDNAFRLRFEHFKNYLSKN